MVENCQLTKNEFVFNPINKFIQETRHNKLTSAQMCTFCFVTDFMNIPK